MFTHLGIYQTVVKTDVKRSNNKLTITKRNQQVPRHWQIWFCYELADKLLSELEFLLVHLFKAQRQQQQIASLDDLRESVTTDFVENYSCFYQNEIQGAPWSKDSVTIQPCNCHFQCPKDNQIVDTCDRCVRLSQINPVMTAVHIPSSAPPDGNHTSWSSLFYEWWMVKKG